MKEEELRGASECAHCHRKIGECRALTFYRVTIERHMLDIGALQRQQGLAMMMGGNGRIANAMGPDEEMTHVLSYSQLTICEECSMKDIACVAMLAEQVGHGEQSIGSPGQV